MTSFDAYWLNYLSRRSKLKTRIIHYLCLGVCQVIGIALATWFQSWGYLLICLIAYGIARASRELPAGEKANPYVTKAIYNITCFLRMLVFEFTGKLPPEMKRIRPPSNR